MNRLNVLLLLALVVSGIYLVQVSYETRRLFNELDKSQNQQRQLDIEFERLLAERQSQATPSRVEKAAREKLLMRSATPAITYYVKVPLAVSVPSRHP